MRKAILAFLFSALPFYPFANTAIAQERFTASRPFATADEAARFADALSKEHSVYPFLCEFAEDASLRTAYRVIHRADDVIDRKTSDAGAEEMRPPWWHMKEGFTTPEAAKDFANKERALAQFVSCWTPDKREANKESIAHTTITVFYVPGTLQKGYAYEVVDKTFGSAKAAADYAGENLKEVAGYYAQFVPEFSVQMVSSNWRIITLTNGATSHGKSYAWRAKVFDDLNAALRESPYHVVASFSLSGIRNTFVSFALSPNDERGDNESPETALMLPAEIHATEGARKELGDDAMVAIVRDVDGKLFRQTKTHLFFGNKLETATEVLSSDPDVWGNSIPRKKNTLAILFTDAPLAKVFNGEPVNISGYSGKGWVVVSLASGTGK